MYYLARMIHFSSHLIHLLALKDLGGHYLISSENHNRNCCDRRNILNWLWWQKTDNLSINEIGSFVHVLVFFLLFFNRVISPKCREISDIHTHTQTQRQTHTHTRSRETGRDRRGKITTKSHNSHKCFAKHGGMKLELLYIFNESRSWSQECGMRENERLCAVFIMSVSIHRLIQLRSVEYVPLISFEFT